jgi:hypothetical protein
MKGRTLAKTVIDEITVEGRRYLPAETVKPAHDPAKFPYEGCVVIRTVTMYYTGRVKGTTDGFVILGEAAWIADAGRWSKFLADGTATEVEPFPDEVAVSIGSIVDVAPWTAALPRSVK